ncbi:MAG: hypothetical protein ABI036_13425, partial [Fibrobacteria bacterium]
LEKCGEGRETLPPWNGYGSLPNRRGIPSRELQAGFTAHLHDIRNRVFLHHLWRLADAFLRESDFPGWADSLPTWIRDEYAAWMAQESLDAKGMAVVDGWHAIPEADLALRYRGIPLGPGLQYEQLRRMLTVVFGCFRQQGSA